MWEPCLRAWVVIAVVVVVVVQLREPEAVATQFMNAVIMSVLMGLIYLDLPNTQSGATDRIAFIALLFVTMAFLAMDLLLLFPKERAVFLRDSNAGLYGTAAFYWGRSLAEAPFHIVFAAIAATVSYWMVGFQADGAKFVTYLVVVVVLTLTGTSLLLLASALSPDLATANALGTIALMMAMMLNGFFITYDNIPVVFRWIADISFLGYAVEAGAVNELSGLQIECSARDLELGCVTRGELILERMGMSTNQNLWMNVLWMFVQIVVMRVLAYVALHFLHTGQPLSTRLRLFLEW